MRLFKELRHIGKQIFVDFVTHASYGRIHTGRLVHVALPPVGIDHEHIDAVSLVKIVLNLLDRRFIVVDIPTRIPESEILQIDKIALARKRYKIFAETCIILGNENIHVGGFVLKVPAVEFESVVRHGIAVLAGNDTGIIRKIPAPQIIGRGRKISIRQTHAVIAIYRSVTRVRDKRSV